MSNRYSDIDVIECVQGNTARSMDRCGRNSSLGIEHDRCVVYDFRRKAEGSGRVREDRTVRTARTVPANTRSNKSRARRRASKRRAARARARRALAFRTALFAFFVMVTMFGIGGIASRAKSREVPAAYKYYDTITVAYQENLLDIVERYDDRDHYNTQIDYVEELCRINNLKFDGTAYPDVRPGTHLVVPYYSTELK